MWINICPTKHYAGDFVVILGCNHQSQSSITMHNRYDITTLFVIIDDFCKIFNDLIKEKALENGSGRKIRNKPCTLSDSEVITILTLFHLEGYRCLKHFYCNFVQKHLNDQFPKTVSYNRFVELSQKVIIPMTLFLNTLTENKCTGISFIDSTPIRVSHNRRIHSHKVFKDVANRGHCSLGFFYGFKLHIIINDKGELLNYIVTKGNKHDANQDLVSRLVKDLFGKLYGDKGYISKSLFETLFHKGVHVVTKIKRNMKNVLMSLKDKVMLRKRALVECVNDQLKNICQIEHSRHRSILNFVANLISGLIAYCFLPKKPALKVEYHEALQLDEITQLALVF